MGDVAVGARSGHDGEEHRGHPVDAADPAADGAVTSGNDSGGDGEGPGGQPPTGGDGSGAARTPKKQRSFWKELPILIGIALVLALLIKTFLVQAFSIPSDSMQNTLQQGDRVLVDKLTPWFGSEPERGEVVVFHDPDNWLAGEPTPDPNALQTFLSWIGLMPSAEEKDLIKRVVGVGGDTVECEGTGPLKVNGKALSEASYVYPGNTPCSQDDQGGQFKVKVPEGFIWVMGDHRQNSRDSRYNQSDENHGMVPVDEVVGRAIVIAWPINRWDNLPVPDTFEQNLGARSAALTVAPQGLALAGAVPLVLWRRSRIKAAETR
ncbi:signal peptidase [Streptomyces viridochromogenes]|uniref:Signal peptidase I n=1 Tax=Streptomyces viridochromogenes TaxID=1938 RepID=A0A0J8CCK5_STRVR|nr:signal peptidase I [Streptomyces viridochromogenes]KMS75595.1 signal peptidase [Streptomyces viridochromogenes]KOG10796.1 signal peptidase [Streptomyces viridochromogenes]KOG12948.1 signal peptidase [Streptomyces viridochromogenes]